MEGACPLNNANNNEKTEIRIQNGLGLEHGYLDNTLANSEMYNIEQDCIFSLFDCSNPESDYTCTYSSLNRNNSRNFGDSVRIHGNISLQYSKSEEKIQQPSSNKNAEMTIDMTNINEQPNSMKSQKTCK